MVKKMDTKTTVPSPDPNACAPGTMTGGSHDLPRPLPASGEYGFKPGDLNDLRNIFVRPPKFPVGTTVPERVYLEILEYGPGISQFIEDAITSFNGDMRALVEAVDRFNKERKAARLDTGIRSISGRVPKASLTKLQSIIAALKDFPGMSLAKVLGGLIQIHLPKGSQ
ncbi:MAG: hypothetical protein P4L50_00460 [Anaerolineaceae bacterium]|nr:hypothetical protein [Anaerolineaceae bacterium]